MEEAKAWQMDRPPGTILTQASQVPIGHTPWLHLLPVHTLCRVMSLFPAAWVRIARVMSQRTVVQLWFTCGSPVVQLWFACGSPVFFWLTPVVA